MDEHRQRDSFTQFQQLCLPPLEKYILEARVVAAAAAAAAGGYWIVSGRIFNLEGGDARVIVNTGVGVRVVVLVAVLSNSSLLSLVTLF